MNQRGELEQALAELQSAAALDSNEARPFSALIRIYHRLGRSADEAKAVEEFQRRKSRADLLKLQK